MKITWLGHSGFRIEIAGQVLLIDPWLRGNPVFDEARFGEAIEGATAVLLSHGHFDHAANVAEICKATGAPLVGIYDLVSWFAERDGLTGEGLNMGGTLALGDVAVTLVRAVHSSSVTVDGRPVYAGSEAGFMIAGEGRTIYFAGDTDVHADMALFAELHRPQIGILPVGGRFTMDQTRAAYACRKFFAFEAVIPCHFKTFPQLAQNADELAAALAPTPVRQLAVMEGVTF